VLTLFHGGAMDSSSRRLWLTANREYAAGFAVLYDLDFVWTVVVDVDERDILDVSSSGLVATEVASALRRHGIPIDAMPTDASHQVVWRVPDDHLRAAGFRAVRLLESVDWGSGPLTTASLCLIDTTAIVQQSMVPIDESDSR
jgi:hypothetical protein